MEAKFIENSGNVKLVEFEFELDLPLQSTAMVIFNLVVKVEVETRKAK